MSPGLHATLVGGSAIAALVFSGVILARNPRSWPARRHAIYGGVAAWWLFSMAMIASAESTDRVQLWARLLHLGIGMLPGVIYHLNVTTAGLSHEHRSGIRIHYALSVAVTLFCLSSPDLLLEPWTYSWGPYPHYTAWGAIPVGFLLLVFGEVLVIYHGALRRHARGTPYHEKARAFYHGNWVAALATLDFLAAFGVGVYPFGFAVMTLMHAATMFGSVRYQLIEITPEIAAERVLATMPDGLLVADTQGLVRLANRAAERLLGCRVEGLLNQRLDSITSEPELLEALDAVIRGEPSTREVSFTSASGIGHVVSVSGTPVEDSGKQVAGIWLLHDLTEQRQAEEEKHRIEGLIRQAQRMESLGVMAGGVAHDFNNILTAILGSAEVARLKLAEDSPLQAELQTISRAVEHAAELTDQLLTYAGRGTTIDGPVDLHALVEEMTELLRSAISKKARLEMKLGDGLPRILGDGGQLRQVILNLVTNASEALDGGSGVITVQTDVVAPAETDAAVSPDSRAKHVRLQVTDTGVGMDVSTRTRVFDPFFTTKFTGRGLGLATVLGIVQAHGGEIRVESAPGDGTRFEVLFPALAEQPAEAATSDEAARPEWHASGLALLAEDEAEVRGPVRELLIALGFEVEEAIDGADALETFRSRKNEFAVVVLDLTMPGMSGREVFSQIRRLSPWVPVVFMSGYSETQGAAALGDRTTSFLHKPFDLPRLSEKVREAMDEAGGAGAPLAR